jgi:hypothetical protein
MMIRFLIYFYYFFWDYHKDTDVSRQNFSAYIAVTGILIINLLSIWGFASSFFGVPYLSHFVKFNGSYLVNKITAFFVALPIFLTVYIYYKMNSEKVDILLDYFEKESKQERKRNRMKVWYYFIISVGLLFGSFLK